MTRTYHHEHDETFWRKKILPEEDRRNGPIPLLWNAGYRWFRSSNIVDLWRYRSPAEQHRIIAFMWRQQLRTMQRCGTPRT